MNRICWWQELPAAQATQMLAMLRTQPAGPYAALQQLAQVCTSQAARLLLRRGVL